MSEFVETSAGLIEALKTGQKKVGLRYVTLTDEEAAVIAETIASDVATQRLTIVNAGLNAARMIPIVQALKKNTHLQYLNLNNNSGGTESAKALADSLASNSALTEIFLTGNNVWDEGGAAILSAVEKSRSVQMMDLDGNKVDKAILKKIANAADNNL